MQDTEGGPKTLPDYSTEHSPCSTESILRPVRDVGPTPLCLVKAGAEVRSEARVVTAARGTRLTAPVPIRPRAHGARPPAREARAEALGRAAVAGSSHGGSSKSRPVDSAGDLFSWPVKAEWCRLARVGTCDGAGRAQRRPRARRGPGRAGPEAFSGVGASPHDGGDRATLQVISMARIARAPLAAPT